MALMRAATVIAAGVTVFMVVVIAMEICTYFQTAVGKVLCRLTDVSFCTADDKNVFSGKCIHCTAADSAANKDFNTGICKQGCQCSVSGTFTAQFFF